MVEGRSRRQTRGKQPRSYGFDQFSFLDEGEDGEPIEASDVEDNAPKKRRKRKDDEFVPVEDDEDEADESLGEDIGDEEDDGAEPIEEELPRGESVIDVNSDRELDTHSPGPGRGSKGAKAKPAGRGGGPSYKPGSRYLIGASAEKHARGAADWGTGGQEMRLKDLFGPTHDDLKPVLLTRDKWKLQETFPSRSQGGPQRSFFVPEEGPEKETKATRKWYQEDGRAAFAAGQKSRELREEEAQTYMANLGPDSTNLLMGNVKKPLLYTLRKGEYMSVAKPFSPETSRKGWVFNLGSKIQEAQWVESGTQYLAVAVEQKQTTGRHHKPLENPKAPAFSPTKGFAASIQIWAFDSLANGDMDTTKEPRLEQVICTDWGLPRQFRWWPIGAADSMEPSNNGSRIRLGLLAGIWTDGKVRILDVSHRKPEQDPMETQYMHYSKSAFEVSFADTIPACLHWLSATTLAVGTASGNLAVWTLTRPETFPPANAGDVDSFIPQPWFYKQVADTYILSLTSGYPSRPHYLSITTADGFARLFDLRSPVADACSSVRSRILVLTQAWHEQTQSFVMPDEYYMLKHNTIRRYYANIYSMRINSSVTCCATSLVQPCVLLGGTDGTVLGSNPVAKVLNSKKLPWQQPWFKHEWRPPVEELTLRVKGQNGAQGSGTNSQSPPTDTAPSDENAAPHAQHGGATPAAPPSSASPVVATTSNVPPQILSQPLIRITEGYRAQQPGIHYPDAFQRYKDGAKYITIYEEKSAITKLAWNPSLKCGTWAAAGMASGLLRVEDLGI